MARLILSLALCFSGFLSLGAQDVQWIRPSDTDPDISDHNQLHYVAVDPAVTSRDQLFLMLPGTNGVPLVYQAIVDHAAGLGFHAVGLTYNNAEAVNTLCALSVDGNCHGDVREEVIYGTDTSDKVNIDRDHSILNRLARLLETLHAQNPDQGWDQFLGAETDTFHWDRIVVAGHSQGAGHAGFLAKDFAVARCIQFAGTDWWGRQQQPALWYQADWATPPSRIYGLGHPDDESVSPAVLEPTWQTLGLDILGPVTVTEEAEAPHFDYSHQLMTTVDPVQNTELEAKAHGAMVTDLSTPFDGDGNPVLAPVWTYLLTGQTNPAQEVFDASTHLGQQSFLSPLLGLVQADDFPWIHHQALGYLWIYGSERDGLWVFHPGFGFFWTRENAPGLFWSHAWQTWVFLDTDADGKPWFWRYDTEAWVAA